MKLIAKSVLSRDCSGTTTAYLMDKKCPNAGFSLVFPREVKSNHHLTLILYSLTSYVLYLTLILGKILTGDPCMS